MNLLYENNLYLECSDCTNDLPLMTRSNFRKEARASVFYFLFPRARIDRRNFMFLRNFFKDVHRTRELSSAMSWCSLRSVACVL